MDGQFVVFVELSTDALADVEEQGGGQFLPLIPTAAPVAEWVLDVLTQAGPSPKRILTPQ